MLLMYGFGLEYFSNLEELKKASLYYNTYVCYCIYILCAYYNLVVFNPRYELLSFVNAI